MAIVIAEFCQNHRGDKKLLQEMIWAAAEAGADYAKIQTMFAADLTYREQFEKGVIEGGVTKAIKRPYQPEFNRLNELEISCEDHGWFIEECYKAGIKPLTTVFVRARVQEIANYGWREAKVASYDCASYPLLGELKRYFDHLFVSTGATYNHEVEGAARILSGISFTFLHCVTIYPTPLERLHLARMEYLRQFTPSVGLSDHTAAEHGIKASAVALYFKADVIERHFTLLRPSQTRDGPISINTQQLAQLCTLAHGNPQSLKDFVRLEAGDYQVMIGPRQKVLPLVELLNRDYYRGRFASRAADGSIVYNWQNIPLSRVVVSKGKKKD